MADADDTKNQEKQEASNTEKSNKKAQRRSILQLVIIAAVVLLCAGAGFGLGRLFARSGRTETVESSQQTNPTHAQVLKANGSATDLQETWYYDFEPVVANLNEPGVTRYIRVTLTLEISDEVDQNKATAFLEEKNPLLKNWLTIYLASLTLEDIRGDRNLRRIQSQILDGFNEKLFPDAKPQIKHVLFKEFAVQ